MKRNVLSLYGMVIILTLGFYLQAEAQFTLGAEVRPRSEYRHGFKKLIDADSQDPAFFIEQRTRLQASYKDAKMTFLFSLQDVRIWGSERQIYKPADGVSPNFAAVHQAWGKYLLSDKVAVKVGRQELDYDNARFLGNLGWAQQSRSHDALLFMVSDSTSAFHIGAAFNQDANTPEYAKLLSTDYNQAGNYKTMQYAWYHKDFKGGGISALFFNNGLQTYDSLGVGETHFSQTTGLYSTFKAGKVAFTAEAYYQFGKDAADRDLSAFLLGASASVPLGKVGLSLGADYVSGTALDTESGINNAFTPLYGTNHKFYGLMDYFYVGNPNAQLGRTTGLINPYLKTKVGLPKGALLVHLHHFLSPTDIYKDPELLSGPTSSSLGTEIDLVYNLDLAQNVNLKVGYSQLFATESMELIKGGDQSDMQNWFWTMITFKPTFFKTDKK